MASSKYIFFSDLDDTLLNSKKEVSKATYEALKEFTGNGNIFVICTGRGLDSAVKIQKKYSLSFPHSYIAAYNGCQIYDCETQNTIFKTGIELPVVKDIVKSRLARLFSNPSLRNTRYIAIDEISVRKGHKYITIVLDLEIGNVLFVGDG